jgi:hypothetical protein
MSAQATEKEGILRENRRFAPSSPYMGTAEGVSGDRKGYSIDWRKTEFSNLNALSNQIKAIKRLYL